MIYKIEKQSGTAFKLKKDQKLKVLDPQGEQVSDSVLFNGEDVWEKISSGKNTGFWRKHSYNQKKFSVEQPKPKNDENFRRHQRPERLFIGALQPRNF